MVFNQLFVEKPSMEIVNKIIKIFGLNDINDSKEFSFIDMDKYNTLANLRGIENELKECYLPCKQKIYLNEINYKSAITIFRQFLKSQNYDLKAREKYINTKKCLKYKIITKEEKRKDKKKNPENITLYFD